LGTFITFPELLVWLPFLTGILCFFIKKENTVRQIALFSTLLILAVSVASLAYTGKEYYAYNNVVYYWLKYLGASLYFGLDGTGKLLTLLTALAYPLIFASSYRKKIKDASAYYGLMLLCMSGIMGVFVSMDALLFYFFWELALIPAYFLCSRWGAERRIQTTFKFFVYTFAGSLLMLIGIIFVYLHTPAKTFSDGTYVSHSFVIDSFYQAVLTPNQQNWMFWLFFLAFAIKMPVFPFHTWQPDTYDQSLTPTTMVLSGIMVKMGLFGVIRWLFPLFPQASEHFSKIVIILCVAGMLYASLLAMVQDNLKKLVAYSSIAHVGLMCAALFAMNEISVKGVMVQMFSHGINIIGMWMIVEFLERKVNVRKMSELGGIANKAPVLTIFTVLIVLANIALPLTNGFVGEYMMFSGLFIYGKWYAIAGLVCIILAAVYSLRMVRQIFYGETSPAAAHMTDLGIYEKLVFTIVIVAIFMIGIYPDPFFELTKEAVKILMLKAI